jgi:hypothetical protein
MVLSGCASFSQFGISDADAVRWRANGFRDPKIAADWNQALKDPVTSGKWRDAGFEPAAATAWQSSKFQPSDAQAWSKAGFTADQAAEWRAKKLSPAAAVVKAKEQALLDGLVDQFLGTVAMNLQQSINLNVSVFANKYSADWTNKAHTAVSVHGRATVTVVSFPPQQPTWTTFSFVGRKGEDGQWALRDTMHY